MALWAGPASWLGSAWMALSLTLTSTL